MRRPVTRRFSISLSLRGGGSPAQASAPVVAVGLGLASLVALGCVQGEIIANGKPEPATTRPGGAAQVMVDGVAIDPGRVVAHRLNRLEYNNTLRDLFHGLDLRPADAFPIDNFAEGFDNNAQELRMSNLLLEKYLEAADKVVPAAFADPMIRWRLVPCDLTSDTDCPRQAIASFAERAFRRPVTNVELVDYLRLVDVARTQGDGPETGVELAMRAMLVSPAFLFRIEPDPPQDVTRELDGYEIAARLSYFLWSSMPDDELFARSRSGALRRSDEILTQVRRMLADKKAAALIDNLAGQWLHARQIPELHPDTERFPPDAFDASLAEAMRQEMHLFLEDVLYGEGSAQGLLKAPFTFANRRLAQHYGLPQADQLGENLVRVNLSTDRRGGLLTQGGWLTLTSHSDGTSLTKRGKWIVSELLCEAPPPPPPGAGNLPPGSAGGSLRERLEQHASVEPCRSCHMLFDPLGAGLENYDAIGRWRDRDPEAQNVPDATIDASGVVPGTNLYFDGPAGLAEALQKDPRFARCLTRKLLTFALGRGMEPADAPALEYLTERFAATGYRLRALVETIALSPLMTMRGGRSEP